MTLSEASLLAFTAFSGIRLVSYFPQIYRVARDRNGASAISYATWAVWIGCHVSTGLYAAVNLGDGLLAAASLLYALCCLAVIAITASKRRRSRQYLVHGAENPDAAAAAAEHEAHNARPRPAYVSKSAA